MADLAPYQNREFGFARLLGDLSKAWPTRDIDYVRDVVAHAEYGDALENLIAIGATNGRGFTPVHVRQIAAIGAAIGLDTAALMAAPAPLRQPPSPSAA